jgi:hypothetical protein
MDQRTVAQPTGLQLSNLAEPRAVEVTQPERGQSIPVERDDSNFAKPDPQAVAKGASQQDVNGTQLETLASNTVGQSVLPDADKIPASGADFNPASVDALPGGALPLALLGQEKLAAHIGAVDDGASRHVAQMISLSPTITIPSPGGPATMVFEAGLGARNGEPPGTHAGQPTFPVTTKAGTINFVSPDGVQTVSLGGHTLTAAAQTFPDGATGSLTASFTFNAATGKGTISYSYTLLDNTLGIPSASFAVVVTDRDGHSNPPGNLVISIVDDVPVARADTDAITPGQMTPETGNVLTGAGTTSGVADVQGADGGMSVVGVAAGNGPGGAAPGTVGVAISGAHGALTLLANGSYSYVHAVGGGTDVFTYTVRDSDGSLAHATLTMLLGNSAPGNFVIPAPGLAETQAFEAGLLAARGPGESAGSRAGDPAFPTTTQTGTITFTSPPAFPTTTQAGTITFISAAPGGADTQVFEAGLLAARGPGESAGSHAGDPAFPTTTQAGTITFTSAEDDGRDPNKESHLEPRTDAPTYAFGNKWKNAERGLSYGKIDNKILPMSRKIISR